MYEDTHGNKIRWAAQFPPTPDKGDYAVSVATEIVRDPDVGNKAEAVGGLIAHLIGRALLHYGESAEAGTIADMFGITDSDDTGHHAVRVSQDAHDPADWEVQWHMVTGAKHRAFRCVHIAVEIHGE